MDQELLYVLHVCRADASCVLTRRQHFSVSNHVIAAVLKVCRKAKIRRHQLMHIYLRTFLKNFILIRFEMTAP